METFTHAGEAMILAAEGQRQIGSILLAGARRQVARIREWLAAMPTTMPPTQSWPRR